MATTLEVGVAVGVRAIVAVPVGVGVEGAVLVTEAVGVRAGVAVRVGVRAGVAVEVLTMVGVGVAPPFCTVTLIEAFPSSVPFAEYAAAEIAWSPLGTVVESQLKV